MDVSVVQGLQELGRHDVSVEEAKLRISSILSAYAAAGNAEGIASLLREVPTDAEFADLICDGFLKLRALDRSFFSRSQRLLRLNFLVEN